MNYLKQILAFNQRQKINPLSQGQFMLWHALMDINNDCAWIEWFTVANLRLELFTGLSRQTIDKARNSLKQLGFIDYKSNGNKAASYKINKLYEDTLQPSLQESSQLVDNKVATELTTELPNSLQNSSTLNKQNKTKQNKSKVAAVHAREEQTENLLMFYQENFGFAGSFIIDDLQQNIEEYGHELVKEALVIALQQNKSYKYAQGVLNNWRQKGIKTLEQARAEKKFHQKNQTSNSAKGGYYAGIVDF